jgi:hypothetical protein
MQGLALDCGGLCQQALNFSVLLLPPTLFGSLCRSLLSVWILSYLISCAARNLYSGVF